MSLFFQEVPANLGRFFDDRPTAVSQPRGYVSLSKDRGGLVFNAKFAPELIRWDSHYITTNMSQDEHWSLDIASTILSLARLYFESAENNLKFVEVGCGQGEVVKSLQNLGATCAGFDPVLRNPGPGLHATLFRPGTTRLDFRPDVFIMRCVLPHVQYPEEALREIFRTYPEALIFVEFQSLEATLRSGAFWQISHDHVNYFNEEWFGRHFSLVDSGALSDEWAWVLIGNSEHVEGDSLAERVVDDFECELGLAKEAVLDWFAEIQPAVVLGAGGKGANLSFQLMQEKIDIAVVDLDARKQFKFLECSGLQVLPYDWLNDGGKAFKRVLLNPSYKDEMAKLLGSTSFEVLGT